MFAAALAIQASLLGVPYTFCQIAPGTYCSCQEMMPLSTLYHLLMSNCCYCKLHGCLDS